MSSDTPSPADPWPVQQVLMDLHNPWLRLVGERLQPEVLGERWVPLRCTQSTLELCQAIKA